MSCTMYFMTGEKMNEEAFSTIERQQATGGYMQEITEKIDQAKLASGAEAVLLHFQIASDFLNMKKWADALDWYNKVDPELLPDAIEPDLVSYQTFMCHYNLKDRGAAQDVLEYTRKKYPNSQFIAPMRQLVDVIPQ